MGVPESKLSRVKKGDKEEVKRRKGVGEGTGEGERGGQNDGKPGTSLLGNNQGNTANPRQQRTG